MIIRALGILSLLIASFAHGQPIDPKPPSGWEAMNLWDALPGTGMAERLPLGCETGIDSQMLAAGQRNMTVRCAIGPRFGGLAQSFEADEFRGKRIRFSARIKSRDIEDVTGPRGELPRIGGRDIHGRGGLWVRVLSERPNVPLVEDASLDRGLSGTVDWTPAEVVLDVPREATTIRIGFAVQGRGQLWITDMKFEEVSRRVPVTAEPAAPTNLELKTN